jgi:hypothetical protein
VEIVPIGLRAANAFVERHHRHSQRSQGHKFSVAIEHRGEVIGVAIAGRPRAGQLQQGDPRMLEVYRVCVPSQGAPRNACSMLYGACCRAGRAMGYLRCITYTKDGEDGASLKASGFRCVAEVRPETWDRRGRPRADKHEIVKRFRWLRDL